MIYKKYLIYEKIGVAFDKIEVSIGKISFYNKDVNVATTIEECKLKHICSDKISNETLVYFTLE